MRDLWYVFKKETIGDEVIEESWIDFAIVGSYRGHKIVTPRLKKFEKATRGFSKALIIKHKYLDFTFPFIVFRVYNKECYNKNTYHGSRTSAVKILYMENDIQIEEMPEPPIEL